MYKPRAHIGPFKHEASKLIGKSYVNSFLRKHNRTWDERCQINGNTIHVYFDSPYDAVDFEEEVMQQMKDFLQIENQTWHSILAEDQEARKYYKNKK
jgi:hypothetical protein